MTRWVGLHGTAGSQRWTPKVLGSDLKLWLDADDASTFTQSSSIVSEWRDKSGNGVLLRQSISERRPTRQTNSINGRAAVNFDGSDDGMINSTNYEMFPTNTTANTWFTIIQFDNVANQRCFFCWSPSKISCATTTAVELHTGLGSRSGALSFHRGCDYGAVTVNSTVTTAQTYLLSHHVLSSGSSPSNLELYLNGVKKTLNNTASAGWLDAGSYKTGAQVAFSVGARIDNGGNTWDNPMDGRIGELLLVRKTLSTSERQIIEGYLAWRWGLATSLPSNHPYKTYAP